MTNRSSPHGSITGPSQVHHRSLSGSSQVPLRSLSGPSQMYFRCCGRSRNCSWCDPLILCMYIFHSINKYIRLVMYRLPDLVCEHSSTKPGNLTVPIESLVAGTHSMFYREHHRSASTAARLGLGLRVNGQLGTPCAHTWHPLRNTVHSNSQQRKNIPYQTRAPCTSRGRNPDKKTKRRELI